MLQKRMEYKELFTRVFSNVKTRENYISRLNGMLKKLEQTGNTVTMYDIVATPDIWYPLIREAYPAITTRKNILTAILVIVREEEEFVGVRERWKKLHEDLRRHLDVQIRKSEPTNKQVANYTSFEEITAKYQDLVKSSPHATRQDSLHFILLSLIVHLRPKRADLGSVLLFKKDPNRTDINYVVLRDAKEGSSFLSMNVYKTSKFYKKVEEELPPALVRDLSTSIARWPRSYLFVKEGDRKGEEPMSNNTYTAFVQRTFEHYFGRATGVSLLRHIYISEKVDFDNMTLEEQEEEARLMLHTAGLQRQYKWPKKTLCPKLCANYMQQQQSKNTRRIRRGTKEGGTRRQRRSVAYRPGS